MLPLEQQPDAASLPLFTTGRADLAAFLAARPPAQRAFLEAGGFTAAAGELRLLPGGSGLSGAVLGLGEGAPSLWHYGALAMTLPEGTLWHLHEPAPEAQAALGWCLGAYRFTRYRAATRRPARLRLQSGQPEAIAAAEATWRVRDLINTPAADLGPADLAAEVAALAARHDAQVTRIAGEELASRFPAVAAVGQGSHRPPEVAILQWGSAEHPLVALCGKGVVFDTGGLDLKGPEGMRRMKKDMGGAAILLGLAEMIMRAGLPVRLMLSLGCVENAVSDRALRPGDVIRTRSGRTVEIGNTDAEGRLVLADLLCHAAEQKPALVVDCATLTGAARVALGPDLPALFTTDEGLASTLLAAGRSAEDPLWQLPIHAGYDSWLDSSVATLNNVAPKPMAGAVVAALFLKRFVPDNVRWAHLDLYAWNDTSRPGRPEGGEAQAMRALFAAFRKFPLA
ncbi:leucyl aminopeptidase family protein [Roseomonas sp. M0104]|uniref:Leucyl aminopeptidase family protein n=1 Tax=Teichococcus coralli TaxID=2545983 RepID=A0A845BF69_9PROT|nr:leucyl aminopeptidase family protein [Pseudoroseomonas coralli]MXP63977.1 leucyl aminopeptidase family protein [Pseudoroseomonas coralli]